MCMIKKSTGNDAISIRRLIANACCFAHLPVTPPSAFGKISPVSRFIGKGSDGSICPVRQAIGGWPLFAHLRRLSDVSNRREPDIADPESQLADSAPTTFALGRTEVRAKAVIPSQGRRDLDEIRKAGLYDQIWQAFADTLGITGHGRAYDRIVALRAVTSIDGMIADFYPYDMSFLARTATRIINEVRRVNRVVHDVTSKPPGTIEWE